MNAKTLEAPFYKGDIVRLKRSGHFWSRIDWKVVRIQRDDIYGSGWGVKLRCGLPVFGVYLPGRQTGLRRGDLLDSEWVETIAQQLGQEPKKAIQENGNAEETEND